MLVCLNIESIRQFLSWITNTELFPPKLYFLSKLPAELDFGETAAVVAMALTLSFLATLYPSWRAARLDPVEAFDMDSWPHAGSACSISYGGQRLARPSIRESLRSSPGAHSHDPLACPALGYGLIRFARKDNLGGNGCDNTTGKSGKTCRVPSRRNIPLSFSPKSPA